MTQHHLSRSFAASTILVLATLACSRVSSVAEAVYIPGDSPVSEKIAVAERIGNKVWQEGLTSKVKTAYPTLTEEQLAGVFIRWETISVTPVTGEAEPSAGARIRTGIEFRGSLGEAQAIADLCGDIVEAEVSDHFGGAHEVHRIDLSEQALVF